MPESPASIRLGPVDGSGQLWWGLLGEGGFGVLSALSIAMELFTDTIQVCAGLTVLSILVLSCVVPGSEWQAGVLALLLGNVLVGELVVNYLDRLLDPLSSAGLGLCAWDEGISLLGFVPEEGF